ncbi:MAG: stage 0 sporulation protein [Lentisphaerae bacterium]|nr:stage 0 sporulation protein [Lentisphaerota bacterium]
MLRSAYVEIEDGPRLICAVPEGVPVHVGDECILENGEVQEVGHIAKLEDKPVPPEEGENPPTVLRMATLQDHARAGENAVRSKMALQTVAERARERDAEIHIVRGRYSFDRSHLRVLFSSDSGLDDRALARDLAHELKCRVDMRQIGVRDEAGIIGGIGTCGRKLCCCTWLRQFDTINVKMAKVQKISLNPGAISGNCGRLKCCLRYEYENYREMGRGLPYTGTTVECPNGSGYVVAVNVLLQRVKVRLEDGQYLEYDANDIRPVPAGGYSGKDVDEKSEPERVPLGSVG